MFIEEIYTYINLKNHHQNQGVIKGQCNSNTFLGTHITTLVNCRAIMNKLFVVFKRH